MPGDACSVIILENKALENWCQMIPQVAFTASWEGFGDLITSFRGALLCEVSCSLWAVWDKPVVTMLFAPRHFCIFSDAPVAVDLVITTERISRILCLNLSEALPLWKKKK